MASSRFSVRQLFSVFAATAAATLLANCGGAGSQSPLAPQSNTLAAPFVKDHCTAHGGVRVTPCSVDLTASNPGPDTVVVRTPQNKKGTLTESDNCASAGIATLTQGSGDTWTVTAGANTGSCTATFDFTSGKHHKVVGSAQLAVTNSI